MNSKQLSIVLGVIVVILLAVVGYMAFSDNSQTDTLSQQNTAPNSNLENNTNAQPTNKAPTPTNQTAANLKTYTNTKYGFEVKHPSQWVITSETNERVQIGDTIDTMGGDGISFEFSPLSEKDWVNQNLQKNLDTKTQKITAEGIKTIAGVNWSVYNYQYKTDPATPYRWITKHNNTLYIFSTENPNNAEKLLSTFKFTK